MTFITIDMNIIATKPLWGHFRWFRDVASWLIDVNRLILMWIVKMKMELYYRRNVITHDFILQFLSRNEYFAWDKSLYHSFYSLQRIMVAVIWFLETSRNVSQNRKNCHLEGNINFYWCHPKNAFSGPEECRAVIGDTLKSFFRHSEKITGFWPTFSPQEVK